MKTINICLLFSGVLAVFFLSGCRGPIQLYPGPELPESEVAILIIIEKVIDMEIDGTAVSNLGFKRSRIAILPGTHEIKWTIERASIGPRISYAYDGSSALSRVI